MTRSSFNLVSEPWIPVETRAGTIEEVSITTVFEKAPSLGRIRAENPMLTATLYRFLLTFLYRTNKPTTYKAWAATWREGTHWNPALADYLNEVEVNFDLFDSERPFLQTPKATYATASVQKLIHEAASGNNPVFWTHTIDSNPRALTFSGAARRLIAMQSTGFCGLVGPGRGNFTDGLLIGETVNIVEGENLFETLHLNLLVSPGISDTGNDLPSWELGPPTADPRPVSGILDYLSRASRRIHLVADEQEAMVREAEMLPGSAFGADVLEIRDPMLAYDYRDEKKGVRSIHLRPDRSAWRYADVLLSIGIEKVKPCAAIRQLEELVNAGLIHADRKATLRLLGSERRSGKAVLVQWRDETLPFQLSLLKEEANMELIKNAIKDSEDASRTLGGATKGLAAEYLKASSGSTDPKAIDATFNDCNQSSRYWATLDKWGPRMILNPESEQKGWKTHVAEALLNSYKEAYRCLPHQGASYKAYTACIGLVLFRCKNLGGSNASVS